VGDERTRDDRDRGRVVLQVHDDGLSIRVTPIENGYLVKSSKRTTHFAEVGEVAVAIHDALLAIEPELHGLGPGRPK